ncbi:hypothetical protein A2V94_06440 [Candidatus Atribacteria bacterium RBG_16_35_8]|nr:MAG: hypothetical protein A2V94_06440 [Candidatus Atribacteria bacterium RBG_16_35_8]
MKVKVYHNGDDVFIAWKTNAPIDDCRGFALLRRRNGIEETVRTWVGFEDDEYKEGERRPSTDWPIQKYQWTDYMASPGDMLQYRVIPMVGPGKLNLHKDMDTASDWTKEITLTYEVTPKIKAYFNRGIVATQWVSRRLGVTEYDLQAAKLRTIINTPNDSFRNYLAGPLGACLFEMLALAVKEKREIYAALYELDDEQLESALVNFGKRAHIVLANGSVKKKNQDQNSKARIGLKTKIEIHDRMISPKALGHNKFLVICDKQKKPRWVWTGSQNWTKTGLCTQANNSILIDDFKLAEEYLKQWNMLREAGNDIPTSLKESNSEPRSRKIKQTKMRLWFTPTIKEVDLKEARGIIKGAKHAILFLMFNPGPRGTLLNEIIKRARTGVKEKKLYIRGVVNQDPSTAKNPVELFDHSNSEKVNYGIVIPAAIDKATKFFCRELKKLPKTFAMVHSKVILVDPFSKHPVVMTGSHNLGPKASGTNDENLLIIYDAPGLAAAYATNIMAIYNQYRWRFRRQIQSESKRWSGLKDNDTWQKGYLKPGSVALHEIEFWVGE